MTSLNVIQPANGRSPIQPPLGGQSPEAFDYAALEAELKAYEQEQRSRLGIVQEKKEHWIDPNPQDFSKAQRAHTTLLIGGLTMAQDYLLAGALAGLGYRVVALQLADNEALRYGKEFGNRGQCNPTYFTVGNLIKTLDKLRAGGMTSQEIVDKYVFITAGACGPCRFGTYATEYRKALRDAGFDGFRVMLFQQQGGLRQGTGTDAGIDMNPKFFFAVLQAVLAGDLLNALGYRIRPYEVNQGETQQKLEECKKILHNTLKQRKSLTLGLLKCRRILSAIKVNRLQPKPKVSIIGEFWAMTTEGDGNYKLQNFLESEGAEVDIQLVSAWLLYNIWQVRYNTRRRMTLRGEDEGKQGLKGRSALKLLATMYVAELALRGSFKFFGSAAGLHNYVLPDMDEVATISHQFYDVHLRGGEGHMEVGKLILSAKKKKAHMVISVKPFGCMPSSGVSDGIQSLITARYPEAIFTAIETTGDGAVNVQSRVQMDLFKARQAAKKEYDELLQKTGLDQPAAERKLARRFLQRAIAYPKHLKGVAGTGATFLARWATAAG
ncbi:MAG: 2-hydroxyglutaryl-CoA dehydratase [Proteobacteria bacterium]|nr:2-hydroxyglutaryl-CoA dehydratase [Pseudomonadota bacterium]